MMQQNFTLTPIPSLETAELMNGEFSLFDLVISKRLSLNDRANMLLDMYSISWHMFLEERLPLLMTEYQKDNFAKMIEQEASFAELYAQLVENVPNFTELWLDFTDSYKRRWVKNYWSQQRLSLETVWSGASPERKLIVAAQLDRAKKAEKLADSEKWLELKTLLQETGKQAEIT